MSKQYQARDRGASSPFLLSSVAGAVAIVGTVAIWVDILVLDDEDSLSRPSETVVRDVPSASASASASATPSTDVGTTPQLGETRVGENADTTLLQVRRLQPPPERAPAVGEEWFGIRARTCMHADASASGGLPWSSWAVQDAAGQDYKGRAAPWDDYPGQQFPTTGIQPGECNVGWVLVAVPEGSSRDLVKVVFRATEPPAEWTI